MTVYNLTFSVAKCDYEGCEQTDKVEGDSNGVGRSKLKSKGWWIPLSSKGRCMCLCPTHGLQHYNRLQEYKLNMLQKWGK